MANSYKTIRKAHARSWLCMRALGFHAYQKAKKTCYITMVRSIIEYASPVWSPTYKYLIVATERIQRHATNYILKNPKRPNLLHINYKERLLEIKLLPLTHRREIIDIQTFLKIWNSNNKLGLDKILSVSEPTIGPVTRVMAAGLTIKYSKTRYVCPYDNQNYSRHQTSFRFNMAAHLFPVYNYSAICKFC